MVHFLRKALEQNADLRAFCYIKKRQFAEVSKHLNGFEDRIILKPLSETPKGSINGWVGSRHFADMEGVRTHKTWHLNQVYFYFYEYLSERIGIKNPFNGKDCTIMDNPKLLEPVHDDFKDCDFLIANCPAFSGQYMYNAVAFETKIKELRDNMDCKFAAVHPLNVDIPCTVDYNMDLLQIGAISVKAKYIIAVASAPIIYCFNKWNINTVKKWVVLSNRSTYTYNDRIVRRNPIQNVKVSDFS